MLQADLGWLCAGEVKLGRTTEVHSGICQRMVLISGWGGGKELEFLCAASTEMTLFGDPAFSHLFTCGP